MDLFLLLPFLPGVPPAPEETELPAGSEQPGPPPAPEAVETRRAVAQGAGFAEAVC